MSQIESPVLSSSMRPVPRRRGRLLGASWVFTTPGYKGLGQESSFHRVQGESQAASCVSSSSDLVASPVTVSTILNWKTVAFTQLSGTSHWMGKGFFLYFCAPPNPMPSYLKKCMQSSLKVLEDEVPSPD